MSIQNAQSFCVRRKKTFPGGLTGMARRAIINRALQNECYVTRIPNAGAVGTGMRKTNQQMERIHMSEKQLNRSVQLLMVASVLLTAAGALLLGAFFLGEHSSWVLVGALFSVNLANLFNIIRGQLR